MFEQYFEIFKDSFFANFLFTFSKDFAFPMTFFFEGYDIVISTATAVFGSVLGLTVTFIIFYFIASFFGKKLNDNYSYLPFKEFINKYSFACNIFALVPQASVISAFISGLARMNYFIFFIYIVLFRVIFYCFIIFYPEYYL